MAKFSAPQVAGTLIFFFFIILFTGGQLFTTVNIGEGLQFNGIEIKINTENAQDLSRIFNTETMQIKTTFDEIKLTNLEGETVGVTDYTSNEKNTVTLAWFIDDEFYQIINNGNANVRFPNSSPFYEGSTNTRVLDVVSSFQCQENSDCLPLKNELETRILQIPANELSLGNHKLELKAISFRESVCITRLYNDTYRINVQNCPLWIANGLTVNAGQITPQGDDLFIEPSSVTEFSRTYEQTLETFAPKFITLVTKNFVIVQQTQDIMEICGNGIDDDGDGAIDEGCEVEPVCGNNTCETGETEQTCPSDCEITTQPFCGDNVCNNGETQLTCSLDCGSPPEPTPQGFSSLELIGGTLIIFAIIAIILYRR